MNRILIEAKELNSAQTITLTDHRAAHILKVLESKPGDLLRVGVIDGPMGHAKVVACSDTSVEMVCELEQRPTAVPLLDLLLAMPRPKVLRRLWAPLAMLGVNRIMLTNAAKVERNYFATHWLEPQVYTPRLIEGLAQAGDTQLPAVTIHRRFKPFVEDELSVLCAPGKSLRLLAHPESQAVLPSVGYAQRVLLAIGPEGGWTEFELELLEKHGFERISLGSRRLRTDIACTALIAAIETQRANQQRRGD